MNRYIEIGEIAVPEATKIVSSQNLIKGGLVQGVESTSNKMVGLKILIGLVVVECAIAIYSEMKKKEELN